MRDWNSEDPKTEQPGAKGAEVVPFAPGIQRIAQLSVPKMFAPQNLSLKGRALRALAARDHSRAELERKLASFEEEPGQLAKVLDELQARSFLDEQRTADSLAHGRGQKLGTARVVQEMRSRGIEADAIESATQQLKASERERAHEVWRKKFGSPAQNATERGKQMRFLISRGFSSEVIRCVIAGADEML